MAKAEFSLAGDVGEIVLDDPPLNLFDMELAQAVRSAVDAAWDAQPRAVLVRAAGENFSAGANVEIFLDRDEAAARELLGGFLPAIRRFEEIPCPTLAAVQGLCLAAGFEIALACDMIWAAEGSQLGLVEAVIGATPFGGGTQRLAARVGVARAAEAIMTGRPYPAERMLGWGAINRVVPADELEPKARAFAERLASGPTLAHAATKEVLRRAGDEGIKAADDALVDIGAAVMASEDLQNGARTLLKEGPGKAEFERA